MLRNFIYARLGCGLWPSLFKAFQFVFLVDFQTPLNGFNYISRSIFSEKKIGKNTE